MAKLEVDINEASKLAKEGSDVRVLIENFGDVQFVKETLGAKGEVKDLDITKARILVMNLGDQEQMKELAKDFENTIIVCPHGNTSLRMANALSNMGIKAYSLKGGLAGMRQRY